MEAAARFQLPEAGVRTLAWTAGEARTRLPALWARAWEGFADVADVEYAVKLLLRFGDDTAAVAAFDEYLAQVVMTASPRSFRSKARAAARKLVPGDPAADHARALAERRVIHEKAADGMSWLHIHMSTVDATAVFRRATSTAKHLSRTLRDGRTRDQLRADLLAGMLLAAGSFTRVITDPVTGVVLDMDRRSRTVTRAQYEWLLLSHGTCTRDGCDRPAAEAEIDHWIEFNGPRRGTTDIRNLHPFCAPENKFKGTTRLGYRRRADGTVALRSPTGFETQPEIPIELLGVLERNRLHPPVYGDDPPF